MKSRLTALLTVAIAFSMVPAAAAPCPTPLTNDQVAQLQTRVFDLLERDDRAAWNRLATLDFRAFERGKEYARDSFFEMVAGIHQSGRQARWSITKPRVQLDCNTAVISYINVGSIALKNGAPTPMRWLETAAFRHSSAGWQLFLLTSDRTADCPTPP